MRVVRSRNATVRPFFSLAASARRAASTDHQHVPINRALLNSQTIHGRVREWARRTGIQQGRWLSAAESEAKQSCGNDKKRTREANHILTGEAHAVFPFHTSLSHRHGGGPRRDERGRDGRGRTRAKNMECWGHRQSSHGLCVIVYVCVPMPSLSRILFIGSLGAVLFVV